METETGRGLWKKLIQYGLVLTFIIPILAGLEMLVMETFPTLSRCERVDQMIYGRGVTYYHIFKAFCENRINDSIKEMFVANEKLFLLASGILILVILYNWITGFFKRENENRKELFVTVGAVLFIVLFALLISYIATLIL